MKDLGPLSFFLGIEAYLSTVGITLTQSKYIFELLWHTHMDAAKGASTPMVGSSKPSPDPTLYRSIISVLQYLTLTRPNIAFAVNQDASTINHGLHFSKHASSTLRVYSDVDWAGDSTYRCFVSGYSIFLGTSLISCSSK